MNKEAFANELNSIIEESCIRKTVIAQALGISSSALSQFIHGTAIPRPEQLNELLLLLCISDLRSARLHSLLNKTIEEAGEDWESQAIDWRLEKPDTDEEDDSDEDFQNFNKLFNESDNSGTPHTIMFAELPEAGTPIIDLFTLDKLERKMNLYEFSMINVHNTVIRDYGSIGSPVIVKTAGCLVGMNYPGPIQLVISQDAPESYSALRLVAYVDGSYQVILKENESDFNHMRSLFNKPRHTSLKKIKWSVTVLEFTIIPLCAAEKTRR